MSFYQKNLQERVTFGFDNENLLYTITLNKKLSQEIKKAANEVISINELKCYIFDKPDVCTTQVYFEFNANLYTLNYNNKQDLIEIIENLKELQ